jgi:ParB-like chromosome segregation protein Spo0J
MQRERASVESSEPAHHKPSAEVRLIPLSQIGMGDKARHRPIHPDAVVELGKSIEVHGLLQPIGLLQLAPNDAGQPQFKLVYGAHRLAAMQQLHPDDPAATISAMVFPPGTLELDMQMAEVTENLHRKDLNSDERAAQTIKYIGLLRKAEQVQSGRAKQAET